MRHVTPTPGCTLSSAVAAAPDADTVAAPTPASVWKIRLPEAADLRKYLTPIRAAAEVAWLRGVASILSTAHAPCGTVGTEVGVVLELILTPILVVSVSVES